ncbi:hypothetical protein JTE90_014478 [Oedothorax gibbosus]|uniref:SNRNP25 ubiquitin-like domain-containing protein n=1 Tax=Oedothorax gibbosus TaxID=931172 RepID=A0AAV6VL05_9ARAC|nr:hypothetical protein JTE90_014478 [Oedothorax gibbosus]
MDDLITTEPTATVPIKDEINSSEDPLHSKPESMSHQKALAEVENGISELIASDPLLQYLPSDVTLDELNSLLALEHGRAMTVIVHRADNQKYSVVVEQKATVMDLKKAIQRHVMLKLKRQNCSRSISWRYIWKTYWLYHGGQKLTVDDKPLKDYFIENNSELSFVKRLRNK